MKNWLAFVCVLGSLRGGVLSYSGISLGSEGLKSMMTGLQGISKVLSTYSNNLDNARNKVMPTITNYLLYVNTTYTALNSTYGASQPNIQTVADSLGGYTYQITHADKMLNASIYDDLMHQNFKLQNSIDTILQNYNSLVHSFSFLENAESCSTQLATAFSSVPAQLVKFGQCLQPTVDAVPTLVPPLKAIFTKVQNDLKSLNNQLNICGATSTGCIDEYFSDIYNEQSYANWYEAQYLLSDFQQAAWYSNQNCGELVSANIQDAIQNLQMQMSQCTSPPATMG